MAEIDEIIEQPSDSQKRIKSLSDKLVEKDQETATERAAREKAEGAASEAEKRAVFAEGFADIVADNPAAREFKADIQAKVMAGYSVEDATFAVLGKAGKLNQPQAQVNNFTPAAGGSATTNLPTQGTEKSIGEMTQEERRSELMGRGDLADILAPRTQR